MNLRIVVRCLPLLLALPIPALAEDGKFAIALELRARVETIDGQFRPAITPSDTALLLRTLLSAEYDAGPFRIGGEILDGRVYFERRRSSAATTEINTLEPIQGYVATDLDGPVNAKAGRFTLNLGSRRLLSRNGFRNTINAFTGAQLVAGDDELGATAFWTVAQTRLPSDIYGLRDNAVELDRERGSPHLFGVFTHARLNGLGTVESYLYRLAENDSPGIATADRHLWTIGARLLHAPATNAWDYEVEAIAQGGHARSSAAATNRTDLPVRAGFAHLALGRTLAGAWQPRIAITADLASGDGSGRTYTRFDTLFGSRVFEYGPTSLYGAVQRANLLSVDARLELKPGKRTDTYIAIRPLWLDSRSDGFSVTGVRDVTGRSGRYAGTQLDSRIRHILIPDRLRGAIGATVLFKGRFLNTAPNAPQTGDTHYAYAELTATF